MVRSTTLRMVLLVIASTLFSLTAGCFGNNNNGNTTDGGGLAEGGEGGVVALTASPTTESFGSVAVGSQSASATVTIVNASAVSSSALKATVTGTGFAVDTDGCSGKTLAGGSTCNVSMHFAPTAAGAASGSLSVTAGTASVNVPLSGTGTSNTSGSVTLAITPATEDFGNIALNATSPATTFTVTNSGTQTSAALALSISGQNSTEFTLGADTCTGKTLAAAASCTATVTFGPTTAGNATASLSAAAGSATATASLSGTSAGAAVLTLTPTTYNFGSILTGTTTAAETFTVANTGGSASPVPTVALSGANSADFAIASNTCTAAIPAAGGCQFSITFTPSTMAAETATVTLTAAPLQPLTATLRGTGLPPAAISVAPATQNFGSLAGGATGPATPFVVTNNGGVATGPLAITFSGSGGADFSLGTDGCTGTTLTASGGTCTFNVVFGPPAAATPGSVQASVLVAGTPGGTTSATLTGAVLAPANLVLSTNAQGFGNVGEGQSSGDVPITVTNEGGIVSGTITDAISGTNANQFGLGADSCAGKTLAPLATCTVNVHFTPGATTLGVQQALLTVSATPGGSPTATLTGTAVPPASITASPTSLAFGNVAQGADSTTLSFTVTNGGGSATGALVDTLGGPNPGQFIVTTDQCSGKTLAVNASCTIFVTFQPSLGTLGAQTATLTVTGTPGGSLPVSLIGNAITPLTIAPANQTTANAAFNSPSPAVAYTVTNIAAIAVGPLAEAIPAPFATVAATDTCTGATLAPNGTCTVSLNLVPGNGTAQQAYDLPFSVSAGVNTVANVTPTVLPTISGTVVAPAQLAFQGTPPVSFGNVATGANAVQVLTFKNTGGIITSAITVGALAAPYSITANTCGAALAVGATCMVTVKFAPTVVSNNQNTTLDISATPAGGNANTNLTGNGVLPAQLSATGTIANTIQGSTSSNTFTIANAGGVATGPLSITITNGPEFAVTANTCPAAGLGASPATCTATITFTPPFSAGVGVAQTAVLTVKDTSNPTDITTPTVSGTPNAALSFTATGTFPNTVLGGSGASIGSFTVKNSSTAPVPNFTVSSSSTNFTATAGTCGASLAAGASCSPTVTFTPTGAAGTDNGTLTVEDSAATTTIATATLTGTALTPAALTWTPSSSIAFGNVAQGTTNSGFTYTVTNSGQVATSVVPTFAVATTPANPNYFGVASTTCGTGPLGAGASCTVTIDFVVPGNGTLGTETGTLTATAGTANATFPSNLTATVVTPATLGFSGITSLTNIQGGNAVQSTLTLTNSGGVPSGTLTVGTGGLTAPWSVASTNCNGQSLAANTGSCTITVAFAPGWTSALGNVPATLTVTQSGGNSAQDNLSGTTTTALGINTASNPFGNAAYGAPSAPFTFIITNNSPTAQPAANKFNAASLQGTNSSQFTITSDLCGGQALASGAHCNVVVELSPTSAQGNGAVAATLDVNAGANDDIQATLTGSVVTPATLVFSPNPFTFNDGETGFTQVFTITNTGNVATGTLTLTVLTSEYSSDFTIDPDGCTGTTLAANSGTCQFTVSYGESFETEVENATIQATFPLLPSGTSTTQFNVTGDNGCEECTIRRK